MFQSFGEKIFLFWILPLDKLRYISYNKRNCDTPVDGEAIIMNLAEQIAECIKADVRSHVFPPGCRLPGYRVLGQRYGVSDGTVRKAFEQLENASVLQRRNRSGTYISPLFLKDFEVVRLLSLVFPEKAISMKELNYENYAICMEIFQGLMYESSSWNSRVEFCYMPETDNRILLEQQVRQLKGSHGVVMIGGQLQALRSQLKKAGIPILSIFAWQEMGAEEENRFNYSFAQTCDDICDYLRRAGYRKIILISETEFHEYSHREEELKCRGFQERGMRIEAKFPFGHPELMRLFRRNDPECVYFPVNSGDISRIYRFAYDEGLQIGRDFDLLGLASGFSFANYFPPLSYFRKPYFEIGRAAACSMLGKDVSCSLRSAYIQGNTTRSLKFHDEVKINSQ